MLTPADDTYNHAWDGSTKAHIANNDRSLRGYEFIGLRALRAYLKVSMLVNMRYLHGQALVSEGSNGDFSRRCKIVQPDKYPVAYLKKSLKPSKSWL